MMPQRQMVKGREMRVLLMVYWTLLVMYLGIWGRVSVHTPPFFDDGATYSMAFARLAGFDFFGQLVDNRPPLLVNLIAAAFLLSPTVIFVKWLSVAAFAVILALAYRAIRLLTGRAELGCVGVSVLVTNWPVRNYAIVEISQSYWQASISLSALLVVLTSMRIDGGGNGTTSSQRTTYVSCAVSGLLWALAFGVKQQAVTVLPAIVAAIIWLQRRAPARNGLYAVGAFLAGAIGGLLPLYYWILGDASLSESFRYVVLANTARNARVPYDSAWWLTKADVLWSVVVSSLRIPIILVIAVFMLSFSARWLKATRRPRRPDQEQFADPAPGEHHRFMQTDKTLLCVAAMGVWVLCVTGFYFMNVLAQSHYLLEIPMALAFVLPLTMCAWRRCLPSAVMAANAIVLGLLLFWHGTARDPVDGNLYAKGSRDRRLSDLIAKNSGETDKLLLFDNPILYQQAGRLPASRFLFFVDVWTTPAMLQEYKEALSESLSRPTTKIVVVPDRVRRKMPEELRALIDTRIRNAYSILAVEHQGITDEPVTMYIRNKNGHDGEHVEK